MGRHTPNAAERSFFAAVLADKPLTKKAVDLSPDTAAALGIQSVSPSLLKSLEGAATSRQQAPANPQPPAEEQPPPEEQAPFEEAVEEEAPIEEPLPEEAPPVEVPAFQRSDAEPPPEEETLPQPELPSRATHGKLFSDKRAHPLQIFETLNLRYKENWVEWEPETLWWAIRRDFGSVGELARNKIMALRVAAKTDMPWLDWDTFENCSLAWNDIVPLFGAYQPVTPAQAAFGVQILRAIQPDQEFAWEVSVYIAACLEDNGWVYAPEEWFNGAQAVIDRKIWLTPMRDQVAQIWQRVRDVDPTEVDWGDTDPIEVHVVKLAVVQRYLLEREAIREKVPGAGRSASTAPPVPR
jgi:hypothetical protein